MPAGRMGKGATPCGQVLWACSAGAGTGQQGSQVAPSPYHLLRAQCTQLTVVWGVAEARGATSSVLGPLRVSISLIHGEVLPHSCTSCRRLVSGVERVVGNGSVQVIQLQLQTIGNQYLSSRWTRKTDRLKFPQVASTRRFGALT